jgi:hypothetical protein
MSREALQLLGTDQLADHARRIEADRLGHF